MTRKRNARRSPLGRLRDVTTVGLTRLGAVLRDLRLPLPPPAQLVFHSEYLDIPREPGPRWAFDVRRPARILDKLGRASLLSSDQVIEPERVSREDLELIHSPAFLDQLSDAGRVAQLLHLRPDQLLADNPINSFLRQTGGTILAAERAVTDNVVTFNLGGGFHHAQRDRAEGFCPINDVAVAIDVLRKRRRLVRRVLTIDLDYHHGNGTALIFSRDEDVFTFSIHGQAWAEINDKRHNLDVELPSGTSDERYLAAVREALDQVLGMFDPHLAIYLAGADPLAGDRMGDFSVSEEALLERDLHVWRTLEQHQIPMAVVLAGGYGQLSWAVPYNFIFSVLTGSPIQKRFRPSNIAAQYLRIHSSLPIDQLIVDNDELSSDDVLMSLRREQGRFLGFYSKQGLELALERYGIIELLHERGLDQLTMTIDTSDLRRHKLRVYNGVDQDADHLVIELAASIDSLSLREVGLQSQEQEDGELLRLLNIDWLCMQNPKESFTLDRPPLPNQRYPGLGISRWIVELLRMMALRLRCDGMTNSPNHYHNAYLYAKVMRCLYPADEGLLLALIRDLAHLPLHEATMAVEQGRVRRADDSSVFRWEGRTQVLPITKPLRRYFARGAYRQAVAAEMSRQRFVVERSV